VTRLAREAAIGSASAADLNGRLEAARRDAFVTADEQRAAVLAGFDRAVDHLLDDGELDEDEERSLTAFQTEFALADAEADGSGAATRLARARVLRDLMNGKLPEPPAARDDVPFNLQKSEQLIWLFEDVRYYQDKKRREYVGGSTGVSVRIARGVYWRVGGFRGRPVEKHETVHVDTGLLGVTTKHVYFHGARESFRIRHDRIVSYTPHDDGVGVMRDVANARRQIFLTGDGWFTYNLLRNADEVEP